MSIADSPEPAGAGEPPDRDAELIGRFDFRSDDYPEVERVSAYQFVVAGPARMTPLAAPFYARITAYTAGPIRFHAIEAVPHAFERNAAKIAMDNADYLAVQHIVAGGVEGDCDGRWMEAGAGCVYLLNFSQPARLAETEHVKLQFVSISRQFAREHLGDLNRLHGVVLSPERAAGYVAYLKGVFSRIDTLPKTEIRGLVERTMSALVDVLSPWIASPRRGASESLDRALDFIERNLQSRALTPAEVARSLTMSRTQLYELFRDRGGVSKYIWRRRLAQVHAVIQRGTDHRSLTELAHDYGFANQAHLSSLFRRTYGQSPSSLRRNRAGEGAAG